MSSFRIRPKFEMSSPKTIDEIITIVKEGLKNNTHHLTGTAMQDHITIRVDEDHRHFWSPQLGILLQREAEDTHTKITGVYGPMPNVWTIFAISYLAIGVLSTFIGIIGFAQLALNGDGQILWVLVFLVIVAVVLYVMSQMGQKLGAAQTYAMHYFFEDTLQEDIPEV